MTPGVYGYIIPDVGDESSVDWCPSQHFNWDRIDTHNHDGVNSAPITTVISTKSYVHLLAAGWVAVADGIYKQSTTVPYGAYYHNVIIQFFEEAGDILELETKFTGPLVGQFDVYCNDNSLNVLVIFV